MTNRIKTLIIPLSDNSILSNYQGGVRCDADKGAARLAKRAEGKKEADGSFPIPILFRECRTRPVTKSGPFIQRYEATYKGNYKKLISTFYS